MRNALMEIARSGILAPSADNKHVFRIELTATAIRLWPTPEFTAASDRLRRVLGLISLGAVVENMTLRSGELGFMTRVTWAPNFDPGPIVTMEVFHSPRPIADDLSASIPNRHTNRRMFNGPHLTSEEIKRLNDAVATVAGAQLIWLHGNARKLALRLIWLAETERFLQKKLHKDLFSSIRFDLSFSDTAAEAIPPGSLEIEPPMRPLFKALRHWGLMRLLTWLGFHHLIGLRAGWLPAWQAPALGVLVTSLPIEHGAYSAGAALERLWLRSTSLNLAFQPLAASAVLMLQATADEGASDKLRRQLAEGWQKIIPDQKPMMIFRVGRAMPPTVISTRLSFEEYLIDSK